MNKHTPNPVDIAVGANIKRLRLMRGISMQKLVVDLGITYQQQQKREHGVNRLSSSALVATARALDVSLAELFAGIDETRSPGNPTLRLRRLGKLADDLEALPEPEFEQFRAHIRASAQAWRSRLATQAEAAQ